MKLYGCFIICLEKVSRMLLGFAIMSVVLYLILEMNIDDDTDGVVLNRRIWNGSNRADAGASSIYKWRWIL